MKIKDLNFKDLIQSQIVNHFQKTGCLTTKVRFSKNIRNLIWMDKIDIDKFFPRSFNLNDHIEFQDFLEDFKFTQVTKFNFLLNPL